MEKSEKLKLVKDAIATYHDFPKKGVIFRDIFGVFQNTAAMRGMKDLLVEQAMFLEIDAVVGLDSRGFLIGPLISMELGKPFVPIRKKGKLPGDVLRQSYSLEYGEDSLEIQKNSLAVGKRILIVDDLLATGGSLAASISLLKQARVEVVQCFVVIELNYLKGRSRLDVPVHSLVQYD